MPTVETSVAVAIPSTTAARIRNGSTSAGTAISPVRSMAPRLARRCPAASSAGDRQRLTATSASAPTAAGSIPPVNSPAIETPQTEPMVMSTRLGGIVSDIAPDDASSATSSPGAAPRRFISGNRQGATAAMSAAFDPEMPETRYIAASST